MVKMTVKEILELCRLVDISVNNDGLTEDDLETQITIEYSTDVKDEDGNPTDYKGNIAFFTEHPDEGCLPLGDYK